MQVLVARVDREGVKLKEIDVKSGTTLAQAVKIAGWNLGASQRLAVWNVLADPNAFVKEGDRIEILPELTVDPMTARRHREEKNSAPASALRQGRHGGKHRLI